MASTKLVEAAKTAIKAVAADPTSVGIKVRKNLRELRDFITDKLEEDEIEDDLDEDDEDDPDEWDDDDELELEEEEDDDLLD